MAHRTTVLVSCCMSYNLYIISLLTICCSLFQLTFRLAGGGILAAPIANASVPVIGVAICKFIAAAGVSSSGPSNTQLA